MIKRHRKLLLVSAVILAFAHYRYLSRNGVLDDDESKDDSWVAVALQCQLGNQLWMLASSYGIARKRQARWCAVEAGWHSYAKDLEWPGGNKPEACPGFVWGIPVVMTTWYLSAFTTVSNGGQYAMYTPSVFVDAPGRIVYMDGY